MRVPFAAVVFSLAASVAGAQPSSLPRTPDGHPDLQGIWANDTVTTLERPKRFADKEILSEQEAIEYERDIVGRWRERFDDLEVTTTGELSEVWQEVGKVVPGRRTSLIVDPKDGRIPSLTSQARARADARAEARKTHPADGPEDRPAVERCLIGTTGPPMLPPPYNANLQIVQTRDRVLILNEMIHDVRIVRMNGAHLPPAMRQWLGDSIGRWDGSTLVVETTNFTDKTRFRGAGDGLRVIERFTRASADTIRYDFTVDDAESFSRPWSGLLWLTKTGGPIYEYACHEGNYALIDILRGARATEAASKRER